VFPIFDIRPSLSLPPLEFCFGVRPSHAANSRPELENDGSGTVAAIADTVMTPTPGIVASRRLCLIRLVPSHALPIKHLDLSVERLQLVNQRLQSRPCENGNALIFVILDDGDQILAFRRTLWRIMPSSAICPRIALVSIVR
jgi:hypothetical protein